MYEVERKVKAEHDPLRRRLETVGAAHTATLTQEDTYYNAPDRDFARTDEALRIRREHDAQRETAHVVVTYKGPLVDTQSKTRKEAETTVDDGDAMAAVLHGLGYEPAATVTKRREQYEYQDCFITLDRVTGIGEFIEVEYAEPVSEAEIPTARERVTTCLQALDVDSTKSIQQSYLELVLAANATEKD